MRSREPIDNFQAYLRELTDGCGAEREIGEWFRFYNDMRTHSSLNGCTPGEVYRSEWGAAA